MSSATAAGRSSAGRDMTRSYASWTVPTSRPGSLSTSQRSVQRLQCAHCIFLFAQRESILSAGEAAWSISASSSAVNFRTLVCLNCPVFMGNSVAHKKPKAYEETPRGGAISRKDRQRTRTRLRGEQSGPNATPGASHQRLERERPSAKRAGYLFIGRGCAQADRVAARGHKSLLPCNHASAHEQGNRSSMPPGGCWLRAFATRSRRD